jgi:uncharacterized protein
MKSLVRWVGVVLLFAGILLGLFKLRFDAEILSLLPEDVQSVRGLGLYQAHFGGADDVIISMSGDDPDELQRAAGSLAAWLIRVQSEVSDAEWQSPFLTTPRAFSGLLAWMTLNRSEEQFDQLVQRFDPARLDGVLTEVKETLATSFSPDEIARLSRDPFNLMSGLAEGREDPASPVQDALYQSADGKFRVIYVRSIRPLGDYRECSRWVVFLRHQIELWQEEEEVFRGMEIGLTGRPVFASEIGLGMESDMHKMIPITATITGLLFFCVYRRLLPLIWLLALLALVLVMTLAAGGLLFGTLNAVSLGFATILLGVTVDYGLVLYQELRANPDAGIRGAQLAVGPGILWSSVTTTAAFLSLLLGSLPGLSQLGGLVGAGVLIGAVMMTFFFLPPLRSGAKIRESLPTNVIVGGQPTMIPTWIRVVVVLILPTAGIVLTVMGWPSVSFSADPLRPVESEAMDVSKLLEQQLEGKGAPIVIIVHGRSEKEVGEALMMLEGKLSQFVDGGVVSAFLTPLEIFPRSSNRDLNRPLVDQVEKWMPDVREASIAAGFSGEALVLSETVVASWRQIISHGGVADQKAVRDLLERSVVRDNDDFYALSLAYLNDPEASDQRQLVREEISNLSEGAELVVAGWDLLATDIVERSKDDSIRIVAPMLLVVLVFLGIAFRSAVEVFWCLTALTVSGTLLLAVMVVSDWSWTLLNLSAIPLLLGLGVDYGIHTQFAWARHSGNWLRIWRSIGVALALCAMTTSIGFASLMFSHNQGLRDLGKICAVGVISSWMAAVIVVPALRSMLAGRSSGADKKVSHAPPPIYGVLVWKVAMRLVRFFPLWALNIMGSFGGTLYRILRPKRAVVVRENLLPVVGGDFGLATKQSKKLFREFGMKLVALWRFEAGIMNPVKTKADSGWERFCSAKQEGKGVLLVTIHLGNWELGGSTLTERGENLLVLSNAEPGLGFTDLRRDARAQWGVETLIVGEDMFSFVEIIKRLRDGGNVALLMDRPDERNAISVSFFGRPFRTTAAVGELARATGCAIVPVVIVRDGGEHVLRILPQVAYDRSVLRSIQEREILTERVLKGFESVLRRYPEQWFQFIPVWSDTTVPS